MKCDEVRTFLDDYLDRSLGEPEREAVTSHLASCPACAAELEELRTLLADVAALPEAIEPERDLWGEIEPRLRRVSGMAGRRDGGTAGDRSAVPPFRRSARTWWMLAAAAVVLMTLSSGVTVAWLRRQQPSVERVISLQSDYARASLELVRQVESAERSLSPVTLAVIQRNLGIIDAAIRESEAALAKDPGNRGLEQMVLTRYQQRLDLLRRAVRAVGES